MTASIVCEKAIPAGPREHKSNTTATKHGRPGREKGWRSRGWTPLRYPRSAVVGEQSDLQLFPFHVDILRATLRELLLLEEKLDYHDLTVKNKSLIDRQTQNYHVQKQDQNSNKRKRDESNSKKPLKKKKQSATKIRGNISGKDQKPRADLPTAEDLVDSLLCTISPSFASHEKNVVQDDNTMPTTDALLKAKPPRKVSEADQMMVSAVVPRETNPANNRGVQEISTLLDLTTMRPFVPMQGPDDTENKFEFVFASISDEAVLRDRAVAMTRKLLAPFLFKTLRLFFGYRIQSLSRERIEQMMAGFLFDTSHALFAWSKTEQDILGMNPKATNIDATIRNSLFDERALENIGGFGPSSILPHAIAIGRLRRQNITWNKFSKTPQGKRMLGHYHNQTEASLIEAGKLRRGKRLRQRHWLTSALLGQDNDGNSTSSVVRSRANSLVSEFDDESGEVPTLTLDRLPKFQVPDIPGSKVVTLVKDSKEVSWGISLLQEGNACIVGNAPPTFHSGDSYLRSGDMVLQVQNEAGEDARSPFASSGPRPSTTDWFQEIVDTFKNGRKLRVTIQRI